MRRPCRVRRTEVLVLVAVFGAAGVGCKREPPPAPAPAVTVAPPPPAPPDSGSTAVAAPPVVEPGVTSDPLITDPQPDELSDCLEGSEPPLLAAVEAKKGAWVKQLLGGGADPNVCYHYGEGSFGSPLDTAIRENGSEEIVLLLLEGGANPNLKPPNSTHTMLQLARMHMSEKVIAAVEAASAKHANR